MFDIIFNFNSTSRKTNAIKQVTDNKIVNNGIVNIHRINPNNIGDYYCGPHLYFEELRGKSLDISEFRSIKKSKTENWIQEITEKQLIIGGGGLLNIKHFKMQMDMFEKLAANGKKIIIWGAGHNEIDIKHFKSSNKYWTDMSKFGLVGTRDYSMDNEWVPCVSCLHPIFDRKIEVTQEIGIIYNTVSKKDKELKRNLSQYNFTDNTTSLEDMISFISKSETIVTNSYHAMYWSILLGKKVLSIPATSKFLDFKYKTPIVTFDNFKDHIKNAPKYTGVLEECREINLKFAEKAFNYLNI